MPKILIAEDDETVRGLMGEVLHRAGYDVFQAEDGLAAYNAIREVGGAFDILITDMRMPHMDGAELIGRLRVEYPGLKILGVSAFSDPMPGDGHYFLEKPFTATALRTAVETILAGSRIPRRQPATHAVGRHQKVAQRQSSSHF